MGLCVSAVTRLSLGDNQGVSKSEGKFENNGKAMMVGSQCPDRNGAGWEQVEANRTRLQRIAKGCGS